MVPVLSVFLVAGSALFWPAAEPTSYLHRMQPKDNKVEFQKELFRPQEGDLVLYDSHQPVITRIYKLVGTDGPLHTGIIYKKTDGTPAVLEAGAEYVPKVASFDIHKRLHEYDGSVLVRRLKSPLTEEQSRKLTDFCVAQDGKYYAVGRLVLQGTPLRARGWRTPWLGRTALDRDRWICSELVVAAATAASVLDAKLFPANGLYPRDLTYDEHYDLSPFYERPALWYPRADLEFVEGGIRVFPAK
jgi:hypothetical protein